MKMKVAIQSENIRTLNEALKSKCDTIRFGSEFCEWKIPTLDALAEAHALTRKQKKKFVYVTPRVSNEALETLRTQLAFLETNGPIDIVANDLGVLNIIKRYQTLQTCLGRQLVYMPARTPWKQITRIASDSTTRKHVEHVFNQTALNYPLTSQFFQQLGVKTIDVDWFSQSSPYFTPLIRQGFSLSVHLYLVPITLTRKCHTARFLGEKTPEECPKHCDSHTYRLKQQDLGMELYLNGNVVYRVEKPSGREFTRLLKMTEVEFVISMNSVQRLNTWKQINKRIDQLQPTRFKFWSRI
jgi:hypothetical protein